MFVRYQHSFKGRGRRQFHRGREETVSQKQAGDSSTEAGRRQLRIKEEEEKTADRERDDSKVARAGDKATVNRTRKDSETAEQSTRLRSREQTTRQRSTEQGGLGNSHMNRAQVNG